MSKVEHLIKMAGRRKFPATNARETLLWALQAMSRQFAPPEASLPHMEPYLAPTVWRIADLEMAVKPAVVDPAKRNEILTALRPSIDAYKAVLAARRAYCAALRRETKSMTTEDAICHLRNC